MWLTLVMITYLHAFWALAGVNLMVFGMYLHAIARVRATDKALEQLDWETVANLTGEVGAIKRSLQKVNNRINGMTASDPVQMLQELPRLQNVTKENGRIGG
jgi:conjugal transfer/entry exclusion protein